MNGLDGWTCTIFRNEGKLLSSELILDAEIALAGIHPDDCGPDGMMTYVWCSKVSSTNPGYCYQRAGWSKVGWCSKRQKRLLMKPFGLAGKRPEEDKTD